MRNGTGVPRSSIISFETKVCTPLPKRLGNHTGIIASPLWVDNSFPASA